MAPTAIDPLSEFRRELVSAMSSRTLVKLTLSKPTAVAAGATNLFVRPVDLKAGQRWAFITRFPTRDETKNWTTEEAAERLGAAVGTSFCEGNLFTDAGSLALQFDGTRYILRKGALVKQPPGAATNDRKKQWLIQTDASWLQALGLTDKSGRPQPAMGDKLRQVERFAEVLEHLIAEAGLADAPAIRAFDMGCGKGYLTFAARALLGDRATVTGVEARRELVDLCNRVAEASALGGLSFVQGTIDGVDVTGADLLVALHACDTATDDALHKAIQAGARLIVVAPCCQKELRPLVVAPEVLSGALKHGIFLERHAEFITDYMRSALLEWCGYSTKVFEFISSEHTAKNTMISAVKKGPPGSPEAARQVREFARFYGIRRQRLASLLGFDLA
jgi:SAM-dependent methyltransferase